MGRWKKSTRGTVRDLLWPDEAEIKRWEERVAWLWARYPMLTDGQMRELERTILNLKRGRGELGEREPRTIALHREFRIRKMKTAAAAQKAQEPGESATASEPAADAFWPEGSTYDDIWPDNIESTELWLTLTPREQFECCVWLKMKKDDEWWRKMTPERRREHTSDDAGVPAQPTAAARIQTPAEAAQVLAWPGGQSRCCDRLRPPVHTAGGRPVRARSQRRGSESGLILGLD